MNHQEIFDTVVNHLFTQGKPAISAVGTCRYRSDDGTTMCAVGCLIPNEMYTRNMEGQALANLLYMSNHYGYQLPEVITNPDNRDLLDDLQMVHDADAFLNKEGWRENYLNEHLGKVATKYSLNYNAR